MAMKTIRALCAAGLVVGVFGLALAKLPAPPPMTDAQKAAAEEAKAKAAAAAATAAQQQATAEDRVAARYFQELKAKGKQVPTAQLGPGVPGAPPPAAAAAPAPSAAPKK